MLVAISGGVSCNSGYALTNFGCTAGGGSKIAPYVTDGRGKYGVIVPQESSKTGGTPGKNWYALDGFNSYSDFVEFDLPEDSDKGYCFEQGTEYNLWMVEPMMSSGDHDNPEDKAYTDIFICPT